MLVTLLVDEWLWKTSLEEQKMKYTSRGMRRRGDGNNWEVILSHKDPLTGEIVPTYHTVTAKTKKAAEKARDQLIVDLEIKGGAVSTSITLRQFMDSFLAYKESSGTIEPSTVRGYRAEAKQICRYIGDERLGELSIPTISQWMADMSVDGYAPKSVSKPFRLLKQALKFAMAQDLITKNPCDYCKPPKRVMTPINALNREDRTRMLKIARRAQPEPLGIAIELALTTGMRRGEICALRWSDLNDNRTISVRRALGNGDGGFYVKEPKTQSSCRDIPLTSYTYDMLCAIRKDSKRTLAEMHVPFADPYIAGTQEPDSRPYNPSILTKEYAAFCKMNDFDCTFHDLRHTFATMMIANGTDVRTVASYLGHATVSMTLNIYADVDPDAKMAAVSKVEESFNDLFAEPLDTEVTGEPSVPAITFTADQLRAMLAEAERREEE